MREISVVCPVFDPCPRLLDAAIGSVLAEFDAAGLAGELILVDDGSRRPGTRALLEQLAGQEPRLRLVRSPANRGPASARNLGLAAARGRWVGFLDADDLWLPGRLLAMRGPMAEADLGWIAGRHVLLMADGTHRAAPILAPAGRLEGDALTRRLLGNFWIHLGATLLRRELAQRLDGFGPGLFHGEDVLFLARLSRLAPLHLFDGEAYAWRRVGGGLTGSAARYGSASLRYLELARQDPLLRGFRRESRWALYSARKGLAVNNLHAGRRGAALRFAMRAWLSDPRTLPDLLRFLRLPRHGDIHTRAAYSRAETFPAGPA